MKPKASLGRQKFAQLFMLLAVLLSTVSSETAYGEDVVIFDGHPLGDEAPPGCFVDATARPYTIRTATFVFDWKTECSAGDVTYEIMIERDADNLVLLDSERVWRELYGSGEPDWTEQTFSGVCAGPCPSISMQVEHPWHESSTYWFRLDIRAPLEGGGSLRIFGNDALGCKSDGVRAQCERWSTTVHVPDSLDEIPHLEIIPQP